MLRIVFALVALLIAAPAHAATLEVGEGKPFATLQAAANAASDGDTILIAPGVYPAGATIARHRIVIRGAGQKSTILDGGVVRAKGILHITGDGIEVRSLTIRNAAGKLATNAAGIRAEGRGLTVNAVTFANNRNGILYTAVSRADPSKPAPPGERGWLTVRASTFDGNGYGDGQTHGIYASIVDRVAVHQTVFRNTRVGHHLKSRAAETIVTASTFADGTRPGAASYAIDLPRGGAATIIGNNFSKSATASNPCCIIAYGFEMSKGTGYRNAAGPVVVSGNTVASQVNGPVTFFRNRSTPRNEAVTVTGNKLSVLAKIEEAR